MLFTYGATRLDQYITAPAVTWAVYNEANDAVLNDENITISASGLLTIGANASKQRLQFVQQRQTAYMRQRLLM